MTKDNLEEGLNDIAKLVGTAVDSSARRLQTDVLDQYYGHYGDLGLVERQAWDWSVIQRLKWMERMEAVPVKEVRGNWAARSEVFGGVTRIHFGQLRAANKFQGAETVSSVKEVAGKTLQAVAQEIAGGDISRDFMPIQIFYHATNQVWVAINNRGFAAHSLAAAVPLRLIPRRPTVAENNRLAETASLRAIKESDRLTPDKDRFAAQGIPMPASAETLLAATTSLLGRTLPSPLIPLTPGPNDLDVMGVVRSVMP